MSKSLPGLRQVKSHQRSWWIVHTQPTSRLRPGQVWNPTNAAGGLFILNLQATCTRPGLESHQRSWWIVHTQPTGNLHPAGFRIPPTQLVDRSYSTYRQPAPGRVCNPTNAVGGSFIPNLQATCTRLGLESHQRSWWIVHTQPTGNLHPAGFVIPPTQLVDRSYSAYRQPAPGRVWNPTNAVGGSFILSLQATCTRPGLESHQRSW